MALDVNNVNYDPFDQAIPGQGMTAEPGSRVWEKPSQFSKPEEVNLKWSSLQHLASSVS